jgi:pimeloyl-ACP methyl ester carboxylesterase
MPTAPVSVTAEVWFPSFGALATEHRVYVLDVIGYGHTDRPSGGLRSIVAPAWFLREFMTAVEVRRAHVVGYSLGGAVRLV